MTLNDIKNIIQLKQLFYKKATSPVAKGTKSPRKTSNDFQQFMPQFLEKASSAAEKDTKLLSKRYKFLQPLLKVGLIESTNKESPGASNQQYVIILKGKAFLGGIK